MDRWIEISENIKKGKGCVYIKEKVGRVYDLPSSKNCMHRGCCSQRHVIILKLNL